MRTQPPATHSPFNGNPLMAPKADLAPWRQSDVQRWYFNPWNGSKRFMQDVESDPHGLLIWHSDEWGPPLAAEQPALALTGGKLAGDHYYRVTVSEPISPELQPYAAECADIIEALGMTFNEGEAFKALWRLAAARQGRGKPGNKPQYDADKAAHYGARVAACTKRS